MISPHAKRGLYYDLNKRTAMESTEIVQAFREKLSMLMKCSHMSSIVYFSLFYSFMSKVWLVVLDRGHLSFGGLHV